MRMRDVCPVPEQISAQRTFSPHSPALAHGEQVLSYEELNRAADRFARHLMQLGVVSGDTVAICMERSFDWIIAALGIMRAGAAYVPLDSVWPDARLCFAVNDSGAKALVARMAPAADHRIAPSYFAQLLSESSRILLRLRGRNQRDGSFGSEQKESECLLQVQGDSGIGVAEIADGNILADVQIEIAATGGQHEGAGNGGRPDDLIFDQTLDVLEHRVSVIAGFGERGVGVGAEQHGVGAVDTDEAQPAQALGNCIRVFPHVAGQRHDGIACSFSNASDAGGGIALEYGGVLGKGDLPRGVLRRLPVRVVGAALDVIDGMAIQVERNTQLDQRLYFTLPRDDAFRRRGDGPQVAGADSREQGASRPVQVDDAPSGEIALERARGFLFDLSPCRIRNGSKLAMEIIHVAALL